MTGVACASQARVTTAIAALITACQGLFHIAEDAMFQVTNEGDNWILDSGSSNYLSWNRQDFISYQESSAIKMTAANGRKLRVVGRGTVSIRIALPADGERPALISDIVLSDVYFIPEAGNYRLISLYQLMTSPHQQVLHMIGSGDSLSVCRQGASVIVAKLRVQVYYVLTTLRKLAIETDSRVAAGRACNAAAAATLYSFAITVNGKKIDADEVIASKAILDAGMEKSTVAEL